jgi:hypothetical protein
MSYKGLTDFYQSDEWRKFREVVIMERLDKDGNTIDERTGKPITRAYDIILHHKIELTEDNVHDVNIALNPDNIMIVSHKSHNYIHNKFGHAVRQIFMVYGAPLSGKTSYVKDVMEEGDLIIDIDSIWECVSGMPRYTKPQKLTKNVFGIRDLMMDMVKYKVGKWSNCYLVGGWPLVSERERLKKMYGAREIFIDTTKEECIYRLEADELRDKDKWRQYIEDWFAKFSQ